MGDRDRFSWAISLCQSIAPVLLAAHIGNVALGIDALHEMSQALLEGQASTFFPELSNERISARSEDRLHGTFSKAPLHLLQDFARKVIVGPREEAVSLFGQPIDKPRSPTFVSFLLIPNQAIALEEYEVLPHTNARDTESLGHLFDAHRSALLEVLDDRTSRGFEQVFDGRYTHNSDVMRITGLCQRIGYQKRQERQLRGSRGRTEGSEADVVSSQGWLSFTACAQHKGLREVATSYTICCVVTCKNNLQSLS